MKILKIYALCVLNNLIRKNHLLTKLIFKIKPLNNNDIHWDFTTLALKKVLDQLIKYDHEILEIGTGPYAILSLYLFKKGYYRIVATDISADYIASAMQTASFNDADLAIVKSNLFTNISNKYDIIFFNSVYIPEVIGKQMGLNRLHSSKTHWCGGRYGNEVIREFLRDANCFLHDNGRILLGFNPHYLPSEKVHDLCQHFGYHITQEVKPLLLPSIVLILQEGKK